MKNIIVLSDGTGNGAAKKNRTNVWRLYSALDLHRENPKQIACYDDGVGSQEFLPLKIVGGAIGWGLKRNVLELYKFLCRNYQHDDNPELADKIYMFGFSRGAFTVRVLAGMIAYCGLYTKYEDEQDLNKKTRQNYTAYRSRFKRGMLTQFYRFLTRANKTEVRNTTKPGIEFIGVWDTVDAYGLPIDQLAILWDKFIFPLRFDDRELSTIIKKACHAISMDDERHTFHPVLWDEKKETTDRLQQVWFSGVHSDVGGGYPMSNLALVPLDWMISMVEATSSNGPGLHFISRIRSEFISRSDWHGVQHDSRAGLAAYYRYKPRNITLLCDDPDTGVTINKPKIHRGVFERIKGSTPYAPTGLPESYDVVATRGKTPSFETSTESKSRIKAMNYALDIICWRRRLYMGLLITTFVLLSSRFFLDWSADGICQGTACLFDPLLKMAINVLPDFAAGWIEALRQNSSWLWGFTITFLSLSFMKKVASNATRIKAVAAWSAMKKLHSPPEWAPTLTSKLRLLLRSKFNKLLKWSLYTVIFLLILTLVIVLFSRTSFYVRSTLGFLCEKSETTKPATSNSVNLDISNSCFATGIFMEKGATYSFEVESDQWHDGANLAEPTGFNSAELSWAIPIRRKFSEPWLKLLGRINSSGNEEFSIANGLEEYKAKSEGELFLFVNDGVFGFLPSPNWGLPYFWQLGPNKGRATVSITRLSE